MASPILDFGSFTPAELQTYLVAVKAEYFVRITGRIQQGSSAAQSYGLQFMTIDELVRLLNGLTSALGLDAIDTRVRPNFSGSAPYPYINP